MVFHTEAVSSSMVLVSTIRLDVRSWGKVVKPVATHRWMVKLGRYILRLLVLTLEGRCLDRASGLRGGGGGVLVLSSVFMSAHA